MLLKRVVPMLIVLSLLLSACAQATPSPTSAPPTEPPPPTAVPPTEAPAEPTEAPPVEVADCPDGLAGETIVFYAQAGLTGPLSQILGQSFINGTRDAIETINANGGVCGATVEFRIEDTQYDATQEIAVYDQYREEDPKPLFVLTYASPSTIALKDKVIEDHIVNIAAGLVAEAFYLPRDGWTVGVAPIYSDQFAGFTQWLSENWADVKPEGAGDDIVVGVVGWQGSFGAGATTAESLAFAEGLGVTVLPLETIAVDPTADPSEQIQSLVSQGANVIYNQSLSFTPARVIGAIRALGLWDSLVVGGVNWSMNQDVLNILGENAALADGYYGVFPYLWWNDADNPTVQEALDLFAAKGYPDTDKAVGYLLSYGTIIAIADIVEHAIESDGYANLSGDTFFDAFKELGTVSAGGLFEFNVVGEDRAPRRAQIRQAQAVDGAVDFVVVQDFFELPDTRPPAP